MSYESMFMTALWQTLLIEITVLILLLKLVFRSSISYTKIIIAGLFASGLTLPYLWFVLPEYIHDRLIYLIVGEILVAVLEAIFYRFALSVNWRKAAALSVVCNLISFVIGLLLL
jgi:hypothetical protein